MDDEVIQEEVVEYRVYKEKPYLNSDREPFGLTLHGKTKEYVAAHEAIRGLMKKGKQYIVGNGKIKILDFINNKAMDKAIVEVSDDSGMKGNVEFKIYNPKIGKKKGATMELRKMTDFDYLHVDKLKGSITMLLDGLLAGDDVDQVIKNSKKDTMQRAIGKVSSRPKMFTCDLCKWQTKFGSALKAHMTRIHDQERTVKGVKQFICEFCEFKAERQACLEDHVSNDHKHNMKRTKSTYTCEVFGCKSTFVNRGKLIEHEHNQHPKSDQNHHFTSEMISPSSSPPRKKQDEEDDNTEVEMMDIEIEAKALMHTMLEKRITELESKLLDMEDQKKKDDIAKASLEEQIVKLQRAPSSFTTKASKIPQHLSKVHEEHLPNLRGYRMRFEADPNGACLDNCVSVHVYEDEDEGPKVKKRVNNHVADNWDNYYQDKIPLPYIETVGVGVHARVIRKDTKQEMLEFLRSEEALMVYSNSQQLLAIANLFNMNISVFTYKGGQGRWTEVCPDPEMAAVAEVRFGKWAPDMALYHCDDTHFDLLVKDNSRIALLGLLGGIAQSKYDGTKIDDEWELVTNRKVKTKNGKEESNNEKLLIEEDGEHQERGIIDELSDEITLLRSKKSGHRRIGPQNRAENVEGNRKIYKCDHCKCELESNGLLNAHMENHHVNKTNFECESCADGFSTKVDLEKHMEKHHVNKTNFECDSCADEFTTKVDLEKHIDEAHSNKNKVEEWNCKDCPFQATSPPELMNHLKLTGHQPSQDMLSKRKLYKEYKQCYTCEMEFDGYWNLMNHRKVAHPSNRKCRNFPDNCNFGSECWYVHDEKMDTGESGQKNAESVQSVSNFKCYPCEEEFGSKQVFMEHKKKKHEGNLKPCKKFADTECLRSKEECWFQHPQPSQEQVFRKAPLNPFPPDQLIKFIELMSKLNTKVENLEIKLNSLVKKTL